MTWEREFVQACLRARWEPAALDAARALSGRPGFDWEAVGALAQREGVAQLLYAVTREADLLPDPLAQTLRQAYFQTARQNLLLFREVAQVLERLDEAGVPVIVLKGAALAETVYGNPAVRPMCDVDLLVREEDVNAAFGVLLKLGYTSPVANKLRAEDFIPYDNEALFRKSGSIDVLLEIHWRIFWFNYYKDAVPVDWALQTARSFSLEGVTAQMLSPEAQLLHLCGHLVQHYGDEGEFRTLWLYDVAEIIMHFKEQLVWDEVLQNAEYYNLTLPLRQVLTRICQLWELPVPAEVWTRLERFEPSVAEQEALVWLTQVTGSMERYAFATLMSLPDSRPRLRYLWSVLLFPSVGFMKRRYKIAHSWLIPFYYPYRWFWGLRRAFETSRSTKS